MEENLTYKLINGDKIVKIPSNFHLFADINPDIINILISKGEYEIKSCVDNNVLESFVNHLLTGQPPVFLLSDIIQYASLSYEFDWMKDLICLYLKHKPSNEINEMIRNRGLKRKNIALRKLTFKGQLDGYHQIISTLFKHEKIGKLINDKTKEKLFSSCIGNNQDLVEFNCLKTVILNGLHFKLTEKEAILIKVEDKLNQRKFIPTSIQYENKEYQITKIYKDSFSSCGPLETVDFPENSELRLFGEGSFSRSIIMKISIPPKVAMIGKESFFHCQRLQKVEFANNSELETIGQSAFSMTPIESICIPSKVKRICKDAFFSCKNLKKIEFESDSELQVIEKSILAYCPIESISIPSNIIKLDKSWCTCVNSLIDIKIIQRDQKNIDFYDNKFLIGKSNLENEKFDVLLFARRDIINATIPSFIKIIKPLAFNNCAQLKKVVFSNDSEIEFIESSAFSNSSLESISFPSNLKHIGSYSFYDCKKLKEVKFSKDSKLYSIGTCAFANSSLEEIQIPHVVIINFSAFNHCSNLKKVSVYSGLTFIGNSIFNQSPTKEFCIPSCVHDIDSQWWGGANELNSIQIIECEQKNLIFYDNKFLIGKINAGSENFDLLHFVRRDIEEVTIPSFIKKIDKLAFGNLRKLKKVDFSENSETQIICGNAFERSSIESISFPKNLKTIANYAFLSCDHLKSIEFPKNSQLESIGTYAFGFTSIEEVYLPKSLKIIGQNCFSDCYKIKKISFEKNSELKKIEKFAFCRSSLENLSIPSSVEILNDDWCYKTDNLINIQIIECSQKNIFYYDDKFILGKSDLKSEIFDVLLFARRNIKVVSIPSFIRRIGHYAFENAKKIDAVDFDDNSELESLEFSFGNSSIKSIKIPSSCKKIGKYSFYECEKLKNVTFSNNSQLKSIDQYAFFGSLISSIVIPSSVSEIESSAFRDCVGMLIIEFEKNCKVKPLDRSVFPNSKSLIIMVNANEKNIFRIK